MLLLSKLDWDVSSVIASDFIEHILIRVQRLHLPDLSPDLVRSHTEALLTMCAASQQFVTLNPSVVASAAVITTIRPNLESKEVKAELDSVLAAVEHFTLIEKVIAMHIYYSLKENLNDIYL